MCPQNDFCSDSCVFSGIVVAKMNPEVPGDIPETVTPQGILIRLGASRYLRTVNPGSVTKRLPTLFKCF